MIRSVGGTPNFGTRQVPNEILSTMKAPKKLDPEGETTSIMDV
jgi:hypothetical protein